MGKRGPGAGKLRAAKKAYDEAAHVSHPWEKDGMPEGDQVLAFLETLPIVSGLGGQLPWRIGWKDSWQR